MKKLLLLFSILMTEYTFGQFPGCGTTVNTFPYTEDFEAGLSAEWNHAVTGDNFDWTRLSGATPSSNTGPAAGSSFYMYIETSSPSTGQFAYLVSDCYDFSSVSPTMEFDYHMYGAAMGRLDLEITTDGISWTNIWSLSGDQGNAWRSASVSLAAYSGQPQVAFRFIGTDGSSFTGDAAIDNINIYDCAPVGSCTPLAPWNNTDHITNVSINTINNTTGCSAYTDYTAISTNLNVGSSYVLSVSIGGGLPFGVYTDCAGWVDWNNDGDFIDANETLTFFDNGTAGPMTALVSVPTGTTLGNKTMRIRSAQGGTNMSPCNTTANGEVEDYTLNVNTNVAPSITVSIVQGIAGTVCLGDMITLDALPVSASAITSYQWYYGAYSDTEIDADIDASQNGVYSIIVENALGEAAIATYTLTVNDPPSGGVVGNYTWCQANDSVDVTLSLNGTGPFTITIEPGNLTYSNVNNGDQVRVPGVFPSVTSYLTQITDANGCTTTLGNPVNEVINGDGTTLTGWTITANGGNGWMVNGAFRTSYGWDRKFQVIDLVAAGYTTAELDTAPIVYASEQYSSIFNNGDEYEYTVTLQDGSFNTIDTRSIVLSNVGSNAWQLAAFTFSGYGPGLRYIRYEHGGKDTEWWAGHYGTRIDNSTVTLNYQGNISTGTITWQCPLPVELLSFETFCKEKFPTLNWVTSSEINNDYYTIERSKDGEFFEEIGMVKGQGNSSVVTKYQWIDQNPQAGYNYYRLKQTDFDGAFEYLGTTFSDCETEADISFYPNPFKDYFTVLFSENVTYPVTIELLDYLGKQIYVQTITGAVPKFELDLPIPTGTYILKVRSKSYQKTERIIKLN